MNPDVEVYRGKFLARRVKEDVASVNIKKAREIKSIMDRDISKNT